MKFNDNDNENEKYFASYVSSEKFHDFNHDLTEAPFK